MSFVSEHGLHLKVIRSLLITGILVLTGIGSLLMIIIEMVGTDPELPVSAQSAAPIPFTPAEARSPANSPVSIERQDGGRTRDVAAPVRAGQATSASPGDWLVNDVTKARARPEVAQRGPAPLPATTGFAETREAKPGSRSLEDSRAGTVEHGSGGPTGAGARAATSRAAEDAATCIETPAGQAPEGKHWFYRFDREDHRKCWYVRARKPEAFRPRAPRPRPEREWAIWVPWDFDR
jgi:hypothetical protein